MKRYIDADLLRKAVEKQIDYAKGVYTKGSMEAERATAIIAVCLDILASIDFLQQEQPCNMAIYLDIMFSNMKRNEAIKQLEYLNKVYGEQSCDTCTNDKGCVTCKDGELWEGRPSEDLEKEIKTWIPAHIVGGDKAPWKELKDVVIQWAGIVARHFYILGLKNNIPVTQITLDELAKKDWGILQDMSIGEEEEED